MNGAPVAKLTSALAQPVYSARRGGRGVSATPNSGRSDEACKETRGAGGRAAGGAGHAQMGAPAALRRDE